ncbi:MAG: LysR substrate-binding domain-containing protein [Pseudomonadota bacterium]
MPSDFRRHDALRLFVDIARHPSFSSAAAALNLTKGAISYQIKTLEEDLGVRLFDRGARGSVLTAEGRHLVRTCAAPFDEIERQVHAISAPVQQTLTIGVSTYFASRWLSPRLMSFMHDHPDIQLRLQPMIRLFDLQDQDVDIAIRWGSGRWDDAEITPFMSMPAFPVGNRDARDLVRRAGIETVIRSLTLLRDHDDSNAWTDWLTAAGLPHPTGPATLIVPDPNVRVQAVIDGQGIALMDRMIGNEIAQNRLFPLSDVHLSEYGYFLARPRSTDSHKAIETFVDWILGVQGAG